MINGEIQICDSEGLRTAVGKRKMATRGKQHQYVACWQFARNTHRSNTANWSLNSIDFSQTSGP